MIEKINRKNIFNRKHAENVFVFILIIAVLFGGGVLVNAIFTSNNTPEQEKTSTSADILITCWNANQTSLNDHILSDIKATGSKVVNGSISSGTTITTTRADFLFHLSNKTVVYVSQGDKIQIKLGPTTNPINLVRPQKYSVIVDGITYTISVNDCRTSMEKLKNHSLVYVIWVNDYYWWG
jgi:hypothetical protein